MGIQYNIQDTENLHHGLPNRDEAYQKFDHDLVRKFEKCRFEIDEPADNLGLFIKANPQQGWPLFEQALARGIDNVPNAPAEITDFFEKERVPGWVDWEQLERAGTAIWRPGTLALLILARVTTPAILLSPPSTQSMAKTGVLQKNTESRAVETATWFAEATKPGNLKPGTEGYKLTIRIRLIHAFARITLANTNWDYEKFGLPINQERTTTGAANMFSTTFIDGAKTLGIYYNKRERDDIYALWRYLGYLLGSDEDLLMKNEDEARAQSALATLTDPQADIAGQRLSKATTEETPVLDRVLIDAAMPVIGKLLKPGPQFNAMKYAITRRALGGEDADELAMPKSIIWPYLIDAARPALYLIDQSKKYLVSKKRGKKSAIKFIDQLLSKLHKETGHSGKMIDNS